MILRQCIVKAIVFSVFCGTFFGCYGKPQSLDSQSNLKSDPKERTTEFLSTTVQNSDSDSKSNKNITTSNISPRSHRRLIKWVKFPEEVTSTKEPVTEGNQEDYLLFQSVKSMGSHWFESQPDDSEEEISSEKDESSHNAMASSSFGSAEQDSSASPESNKPIKTSGHAKGRNPATNTKLKTTTVKPAKSVKGKNNKKPTKKVKPTMEQHESTTSDVTRDIYSIMTTLSNDESSTVNSDDNDTRSVFWRFMTSTKKPGGSRATSKNKTPRPHKNHAPRTPSPKLTTTTTSTAKPPPTTTVYYRTPTRPFLNPFVTVTSGNMTFFDYLRTQLVPRLALSMATLISTAPVILTFIGAAGRKKRDLTTSVSNSSGIFRSEAYEANKSYWKPIILTSTEAPIQNVANSDIRKGVNLTKEDKTKEKGRLVTITTNVNSTEDNNMDFNTGRQFQPTQIQFSTVASVMFPQLFSTIMEYVARFLQFQRVG